MDLINILFAKALSNGNTDKEYVDEAIKALKGEVSADLDTLEELSKALGNDPDFFLSVKNELDKKITQEELDATEAKINQFKNEIVTNKDSATDNTRFAIGTAEESLEVPSMKEFNGLKDDLAAITPDDNALNGKPWTSRKIVEALCPPFETTGSIVQCHPVEHYPLGVVSRIEPVQSGSGDPSPDNVRPISGWDSVHVTRCEKNLLKASKSDITRELNGIVGNYTANNDTFAIKGTNKASSNFLILSITPYVYPYFKPGDKYTILNNSPNGIYINLTYINTSDNIASLVYNDTQTTFTVPEDYIRLNKLQVGISTSVSTIDTTFNIQLEVGSTATAHEPYQGNTYSADFGQTVYGGTLDWNTGMLTVTHGQIAAYAGESLPGAWISDRDVYADGAMPTTGAQVVYKLATPTTIQLTPQQITALSGTNTLYTDSGDTAVSGRADPVWLTQSLMERIAALESAATNI